MRRRLLATLLCVVLSGCAGIAHPSDADVARAQARWPEATQASLEEGRRLYVTRCSNCHPLHKPSEYTTARWDTLLTKMAPRAHLSDAQKEQIRAYLTATSAP